jgi:hypothetical protein
VYDYALYNDLGDPSDSTKMRPVLGGTVLGYPRSEPSSANFGLTLALIPSRMPRYNETSVVACATIHIHNGPF